jgi:hypothetical protein
MRDQGKIQAGPGACGGPSSLDFSAAALISYTLLPHCTLSSLALDSQYTTVFALCCSPGFSPVTNKALNYKLIL